MSELSAERTRLAQLWEEHMRHEFQTCSTEDTLATMAEDAYVNHVPVMTGGMGHAELRQFYALHFIPKIHHMWRLRNAGVRGGTMSSNLLCSSGESATNHADAWERGERADGVGEH